MFLNGKQKEQLSISSLLPMIPSLQLNLNFPFLPLLIIVTINHLLKDITSQLIIRNKALRMKLSLVIIQGIEDEVEGRAM